MPVPPAISETLVPSSNLSYPDTQIVLQKYVDRTFVIITQLGKVGSMIQASLPATTPLPPINETPPSLTLTPLFGSAPSERCRILYDLYASQVALAIWRASELQGGDRKPVILGIALKFANTEEGVGVSEDEREMFKRIMEGLGGLLGK